MIRLFFQMTNCCWMICFLVLSCFPRGYHASAGDSDPSYRACVEQCVKNGCVGERCFSQCKPSSDGSSLDGPLYTQEPLYLRWKQWDCQSDCHYHCMFDREKERAELGLEPLKYHGKWPFQRICGIQEPASVAFSALNLAMHFHGCLSFFTLLYYKLPLKPDKRPFYDYAGLWYIYGLLAVIAWFCSAVFHSRDVDLTEKLDYTFAVALLGYSLILAIIRSFSLRGGPARVMVAAPLIAFTITHIFFLNLYRMDYGWNMKVCVIMGIAQLLTWSIWAGVTRHPSRWKLWTVVVGGGLAMLLEIFDFPPYQGLVDAHALWHASTVPLTYIWWSFIKDDAEYRTSSLSRKGTSSFTKGSRRGFPIYLF
ncbi:post-GPI attachment to proteins factor 3-like isoform X1 [Sesamum indicum]|uniref:Post-GPI attachment to proteins factor 3 n=2 Tax=Sesamum indicum TaxID=4182 RepID=A0A6I9TKI6_SESIN|nr:post-GPI attachment to proteins factor 3-like isoform X1 [Sesamum indicum]XP_020550877.1 post-GPI attachment to proteins factor 3-like isoform X1 [Sesamum indicum]XP_020550878.1 post-GPI attachment to proteins factor 3-like isoform X1 [Sesamum indicum]